MEDLLGQIERADDADLYYLALFVALAIPDMCGALEAPNGQATPTRYAKWVETHLPGWNEPGGGRYVELSDLFEDEANRGPAGLEVYGGEGGHNISDDFHPNDTGYRAIADRLLPLIDVVDPA